MSSLAMPARTATAWPRRIWAKAASANSPRTNTYTCIHTCIHTWIGSRILISEGSYTRRVYRLVEPRCESLHARNVSVGRALCGEVWSPEVLTVIVIGLKLRCPALGLFSSSKKRYDWLFLSLRSIGMLMTRPCGQRQSKAQQDTRQAREEQVKRTEQSDGRSLAPKACHQSSLPPKLIVCRLASARSADPLRRAARLRAACRRTHHEL